MWSLTPVRIPDSAAGCMYFKSVEGILPAVRGRDAHDTNLRCSLRMVIPNGLKIRGQSVRFDLFDGFAARDDACYCRVLQAPYQGPMGHWHTLWNFIFEACYFLENFPPFVLVLPGAADIRSGELRIFAVFAAQESAGQGHTCQHAQVLPDAGIENFSLRFSMDPIVYDLDCRSSGIGCLLDLVKAAVFLADRYSQMANLT